MNINPMILVKLKGMLSGFKSRHPKLLRFFKDAGHKIDVDSVLEFSVTTPDGEKIRTNFKVTPEDKEMIMAVLELAGK